MWSLLTWGLADVSSLERRPHFRYMYMYMYVHVCSTIIHLYMYNVVCIYVHVHVDMYLYTTIANPYSLDQSIEVSASSTDETI